MHMNFDDIIIGNTYDGIPNRTQISLQPCGYGFIRMVYIDEKFCAVAKGDAFIFHRCQRSEIRFGCGCCALSILQSHRQITAQLLECALQNIQQSSAACIHNACLLQYREHFGCLRQNLVSVLDNALQEYLDFVRFLCQPYRSLRAASCHRQNRAFLRLHHCLICRFHCLLCRRSQLLHTCFLHALQCLCKATEDLRSNYAGIPSCASQSSAGCRLCDIRHL